MTPGVDECVLCASVFCMCLSMVYMLEVLRSRVRLVCDALGGMAVLVGRGCRPVVQRRALPGTPLPLHRRHHRSRERHSPANLLSALRHTKGSLTLSIP